MDKPEPGQNDDPHAPSASAPVVLFGMAALSFLCVTLSSVVVSVASRLQGFDTVAVMEGFGKDSPPDWRYYLRGVLLINHMMTFLVPAFLLGWLLYRGDWSRSFRLQHPPKFTLLWMGIAFTVVAFPLAQFFFEITRWVIERLHWLQPLTKWESKTDNLVVGMLVMSSPAELLFSLLVMAVVPAIGEELVFRGVVQQTLQKWLRQPHLGILLTALTFSLIHFQVQRFFAILFLGLVLGYLFYWTGNLWVSIAAHFFNNAMQVVVAYFMQDKLEQLNSGQTGDIPIPVLVVSAILFLSLGNHLRGGRQGKPL